MRWGDEITLIAQKPPDEAVNANGFQNEPEEVRKTIFCNVKSAGYSEFYKAAQAGFQVELKVDVYTEEYEGQQAAELNGKRYRVLKTYVNKSGEETELTLSDLPVEEGAEPDDGAKGGGGNGAI